MHGTSLLSTPGQFGPVLLPQVNKNDGELCFLKKFGFTMLILDPYFMAFHSVVFFGLGFEFLFELGFIILCRYVKLYVQYLS